MKSYKEIEHPAELKIQVAGETLDQLFINAAEAMADIMAHERYANIASTEQVSVESVDKNAALVDFLNELLAQSHIERSVHVPETVSVKEEKDKVIVEATMRRYLVTAFDEDIKAVTDRDVDIGYGKGVWETAIVFTV